MEKIDIITLITKEGKEVEITKKEAELSELLNGAINDFPSEKKFPLKEIDEKTTNSVKEFLVHFNGSVPPEIKKPLTSNDLKNVTDEWSANFLNKFTMDELSDLTVAANYMGINSLFDFCCAKVASFFKDKSEEEVLKDFNIKDPLTEEEKNKIREENKWIGENL